MNEFTVLRGVSREQWIFSFYGLPFYGAPWQKMCLRPAPYTQTPLVFILYSKNTWNLKHKWLFASTASSIIFWMASSIAAKGLLLGQSQAKSMTMVVSEHRPPMAGPYGGGKNAEIWSTISMPACACSFSVPPRQARNKFSRGLASLLEGLSVLLGRSSLLLGRALLHKLVDIGPDGLNVLSHVGIWIPLII